MPLGPNQAWLERDAGPAEMTQQLLGEGRPAIAAPHDATYHDAGIPDPHLAADPQKRQMEWPACLSKKGVFDPGIVSQWPVIVSPQWQPSRLHYFPILRHLFHFAPNSRSIRLAIQPEVAEQIVSRPRHKFSATSPRSASFARSQKFLSPRSEDE